jgi:hypothetical protein
MFHLTSTTTHRTAREPITEPVLMRRASQADAARIRELARLENSRVPAGPFLVAELADHVVAALSLTSGAVVADPFRLTADVVAMLELRGSQVSRTDELATRRAGTGAARPFAHAA